MATIIRNRTIRPSSRLEKSKSYKIDTKIVVSGDTLIVNIDHETKSFCKSYTFDGKDVKDKDSINFGVNDYGTHIEISWSGAIPKGLSKAEPVKLTSVKPPVLIPQQKPDTHRNKAEKIEGLAPVIDEKSKVLILGTMPGVESLKKQAYYGNTRNLFWQLMAEVTGKKVPVEYAERKQFLLKNKIALWDMCQACFREGSLDSNISEETPNDIRSFVENYPNIKVISFNGKESARLFGKHFGNLKGNKLLALPSTSPANAGISWVTKVSEWCKLKAYLHD
jgi:hypoxanthine-DNA glycosylase